MKFPTQISWLFIISCAVYAVATSFIGSKFLILIEDFIAVSIAVTCIIRFRAQAVRALLSRIPTPVQVLCLGILVNWIAASLQGIYSTIVRDLHLAWPSMEFLVPTFRFLTILSGLFHIIGPKIDGGRLGEGSMSDIARPICVGVCGALAVTLALGLF